MANPEQGPENLGSIGVWQTVGLTVPDFLDPIRQDVASFFGFLTNLLSTLSKALEIAKVFATGLLDPLTAVIQKIRDTITSLLLDLRQLGIYLHGDFYLVDGPDVSALKGGYQQYEARMVSRLLDPRDPNRPNFTPETTAAAIFLYTGTDIQGIQRILKLLRSIAALFNRALPPGITQNQITNIQATYGYEGATVFSFNKSFFRGFLPKKSPLDNPANPYNAVNLTWEMAPIPGNKIANLARMPPAGFLVYVSTVPGPLPLVCERPLQGALEGIQYPSTPATREVVEVLDESGNPIHLLGGADQFQYNEDLSFNGPKAPDQYKVYALRDLASGIAIPLEDLKDGDRYYLQRTFYVPFAQNLFFPGKKYGVTLLYEDMPYAAEWRMDESSSTRINDKARPERFYVRIEAVSSNIKSAHDYQYLLDTNFVRDQGRRPQPTASIAQAPDVSPSDRGTTSSPSSILFPDASTERYLRAVSEALAIMVLCRTDLTPIIGQNGATLDYPPSPSQVLKDGRYDPYWGTYEGHARVDTRLEDLAPILFPRIIGNAKTSTYFSRVTTPEQFRRQLFIACTTTANRFYYAQNPPTVAKQYVLDQASDLLDFRIVLGDQGIETDIDPELADGQSILEWLADDDPSQGIALNPQSLGIVGERASAKIRRDFWDTQLLPRLPHFFQVLSSDTRGKGSADDSPIMYSRTGNQIHYSSFIRNLVPDSVYEGAAAVLQLAIGPRVRPTDRGWIAFQVFPQGLPDIDQFFDQILALLQTVQEALDSLAETLDRYIEFLQAKIAELQAFLNRLNALIQQLLRFFFSVQPTAGLIVTGEGTEGLVKGLQEATNKPIDPQNPNASAYGGGVVMVAGGVPTVALDLFLSLFQGDG